MVVKRTFWKLPYIHPNLFKKRNLYKKYHIFHMRNTIVPASLIGCRLKLYNGIWYLSKDVNVDMVGFKLGSFGHTRRLDPNMHKYDKLRRKKKAKLAAERLAKKAMQKAAKNDRGQRIDI